LVIDSYFKPNARYNHPKVQLDVYPVAGVGLYEATHCIARIVKAEM